MYMHVCMFVETKHQSRNPQNFYKIHTFNREYTGIKWQVNQK